MSEALQEGVQDEERFRRHLEVVKEIGVRSAPGVIIPPREDASGRVVSPAMRVTGETIELPNGQSLESFHHRGGNYKNERDALLASKYRARQASS